MMSLTGCLSADQKPVVTVAEPLRQVVPARPSPLRLYDEPWKACGRMMCLAPKEAQKSLDNKIEVGRWMGQALSLIHI